MDQSLPSHPAHKLSFVLFACLDGQLQIIAQIIMVLMWIFLARHIDNGIKVLPTIQWPTGMIRPNGNDGGTQCIV